MLYRPRQHAVLNAHCAVGFEGTGQLIQCGTGGHDIIHHQYGFAGEIDVAFKRMADVFCTLFPRQGGLRCGVALAADVFELQRDAQLPRQRAGNLDGLIKAALLQSLGRQGHGQDEVGDGGSPRQHRQLGTEKVGAGKTVRILDRLDHPVDREVIVPEGGSGVERWRMLHARTAHCGTRGRQGALRAALRGQTRQVVMAVSAQRGMMARCTVTRCPTQQTIARQPGCHGSAQDCLDGACCPIFD